MTSDSRNRTNNKFLPVIAGLLYFLYSLLFTDSIFITAVGLAFTGYVFVDFVQKLGHVIPIKEMILLIGALQWILGAAISYNISVQHYRYYMYVDEATYMGYVVPSVIFLWLGFSLNKVVLSKRKIESLFQQQAMQLKTHAALFIVVGLSARMLGSINNVSGLSFLLYLVSLVLYIGVIYLFYCYPKRKWLIFLITVGYLFVSSVQAGLFHDLLLVTVFLSFFLIAEKVSFVFKVSLLVISFAFAFTIQTVKSDLRAEIWNNPGGQNALELFWSLAEQQFFQSPNSTQSSVNTKEDLEETNEVNSRLNQGWIISKIMDNIPKNEEYLGGETVIDALSASFLPRFLFPDKKGTASGIQEFQKISGLQLQPGTSMGLSITGEFYANFGVLGGWLAMFIYGLLLSVFIKWFINNAGEASPVAFIWLVLLFYQVVKAETELIKIINHLFKSLIVFYLIKYLMGIFNQKFLIKITKEDKLL
jgi:hypothetical protein